VSKATNVSCPDNLPQPGDLATATTGQVEFVSKQKTKPEGKLISSSKRPQKATSRGYKKTNKGA